MTLSPKLGIVGISTLWHFRLPLPIQMFIKVASSPRLSGIGMPSPILSHLLKMQRIVLLSSLLWWELGTNSLITGPGEWLSFRLSTSKLSWSWPWADRRIHLVCNSLFFLSFKEVSWITETDLQNTQSDFYGYRNGLQWIPKQTSAHTETNFPAFLKFLSWTWISLTIHEYSSSIPGYNSS